MSSKDDIKSRLSGNKPGIDAEAIRALSDLLAETGLTEIEVEQNGARIRVARAGAMAAMSVKETPPPKAKAPPKEAKPKAAAAGGKEVRRHTRGLARRGSLTPSSPPRR